MGTNNYETKTVADQNYFKFQKVDDFFQQAGWHTIKRMESYTWNDNTNTLVLNLISDEAKKCKMLIQLVTGNSFRVRFHPEKSLEDYPIGNTRAVVLDTFEEMQQKNKTREFSAWIEEIITTGKGAELSFHGTLEDQSLKIRVMYDPFSLEIMKEVNLNSKFAHEFTVMSTPADGLRFTYSGGFNDFHMIQIINKPCTAKYVGFGEQGGLELVKNNARVTYFNYDNMRYRQIYNHGPFEEREPLYHSDPFFMEVNSNPQEDSAYGIFVDNPSETLLDMGFYNSSYYQFGIRYGDLDYYVVAGNSCADIIKSFSNIIGTARLIPRYALGYHQGCYGYESRRDIEEVVENYRKYNIPLDGIHIDVDLQKDYKTFTVDESKFHNPKEMFMELKRKGVKCSTNITPIISNQDTDNYSTYKEGVQNNYFVTDRRFDPDSTLGKIYYKYASGEKYEYPFVDKENRYNSGKPFVGEVYYGNEGSVELGTTGSYPDLNRKEVRIWWGKQYQNLFDMGLEMVWQDMTTPCLRDTRGDMLSFPSRLLVNSDWIKKQEYEEVPVMKVWNLFSYNLHKATYHGLNNLSGRENKRNFIVGRGCFTGMQRFAGLWTGDNSSSWEFIKINISQILALGLTGQAISGQDIGGFERENDWEKWADPELLIRWTAMGAFLPWFRNHYIRKGRKLFQEPYAYQFHINEAPQELKYIYESVLPVCKYYIELRYTLMQLFYDAMFENTLNGMPICRALFLTNPKDMSLFNDKCGFLNTEFMVGNDFLVAPVVEKEAYENGFGKRDIYLPLGNRWYQFNNFNCPLDMPVEGGTTIPDFDASINNYDYHIPFIVPIYVKEGAVIPTLELEQYVGERNDKGQANPVTLNIYPGLSGSYTMYLDDGVSRSSQPDGKEEYGIDPQARGEYRETRITHEYQSIHRRQIIIERVHDGYTPKFESYFITAILHDPQEGDLPIEKVTVNNQNIVFMQSGSLEQLKAAPQNAAYYDPKKYTTYLKLFDDSSKIQIDLLYKGGDDKFFASGDGSNENPYEINNAEQLDTLSNLMETAPELYANASYKVTADIITDQYFHSIGSKSHPFTGCFDGGIYDQNGKIIGKREIKLKIDTKDKTTGLFHTIGCSGGENAIIKNLKLSGSVISTSKEYGDVGAVAGYLCIGIIDNITLTDSMIIKGNAVTGGVVGHNYAGTIRNCVSYAKITGDEKTGGIVGYNCGFIYQCCNAGQVIGNDSVGGIAGMSYPRTFSQPEVNFNLNAGCVTGKDEISGGIIGCNYGAAMDNCNVGIYLNGKVFGSCHGSISNNYYFAVASYDKYAINKDKDEFENGEVTALLNQSCDCWKQGVLDGVKYPYVKSYPVLKIIV